MDITGDRLTEFLETYCQLEKGSFQTPERNLKITFNATQLVEIFNEVSSPIDYETFVKSVIEVFGYKKEVAEVAIKFMKSKKLIKVIKQGIYPVKLSKMSEVAHILLKFPNGLFWKDINSIISNSFTSNKANQKVAGGPIHDNPQVWLCDKGTFKHIKYLECVDEQDLILKNAADIFGNKETAVMKLIEIHNILKKNKTSFSIDYYELRAILKIFGQNMV